MIGLHLFTKSPVDAFKHTLESRNSNLRPWATVANNNYLFSGGTILDPLLKLVVDLNVCVEFRNH